MLGLAEKICHHQIVAFCIVVLALSAVIKNAAANSAVKCGSTTSSRTFSLISPTDVPATCVYKIKALNARVCQLKLEFDIFELAPLSFEPFSRCVFDRMKSKDLELCGVNSKQHVYLHFSSSERILEVSFHIADRRQHPSFSKAAWNIKVTQIECSENNALAAPSSCLQYFTSKSGIIESFNFNSGLGHYPGNMQYAICLHKPQPFLKMRFTVTFFNIGYGSTNRHGFDEDCLSSIPSIGRSEDYLFVPGSQVMVGTLPMRVDKFCGNSLMASIVTSSVPGPFVMYFNSDALYEGDHKPEIGFRMYYEII